MGQKNLVVNDVHTQLNQTSVSQIVQVHSLTNIRDVIVEAGRLGKGISVAGGRHASGGQQFGQDTVLLETTAMNRLLDFDEETGLVDVEAGMQWPEFLQHIIENQTMNVRLWGIAQKQMGANLMTIGGTIAANGHGYGLTMPPLIADIDSLMMVDAFGQIFSCSRKQNRELFRLVIGGYGLFGVVYAIRVALKPCQHLEHVAEVITIAELPARFEQYVAADFRYGNFRFCSDEKSHKFLDEGILTCYRPVADPVFPYRPPPTLSGDDWQELLYLAHTDKAEAYRGYVSHYLDTSGQIYESDSHQFEPYVYDYHAELDKRMGVMDRASEVGTEVYVPLENLVDFMSEVRADFLEHEVNVIAGMVRFIERDEESFLAWAKQSYACIYFEIHTVHSSLGLVRTTESCQRLIDKAIKYGGSYALAYHRYATREQVEACYPQIPEFLELKLEYDPDERFQSNWYRHYKAMFG